MNKRQNKALLLLISTIAFASCTSQSNQTQPQTISQNEANINSGLIRVSAVNVNSAEPAIASSEDGVSIVWIEHRADKEADVIFQRFDSNGQPESERVRVNPQQGQAKSWRGDPPTIKVGQDGVIYVGWTAKVEGEQGSANTLYLSVSRNNGQSFESPVKVNDDTAPASHGMHSLAVDNSGRIYFAWLDERYLNSHKEQANVNKGLKETYHFEKTAFFQHQESEHKPEPNAELYFAVSSDNGKTFSPNKRLAENVCPCCKTSLLPATDGHIYASWRQVLAGDFRHIAVASSNDNGNSFSSPVVVSDDKWQISACPVSGASLISSSENTLRVAWFTAGEAGQKGLYLAESKDGGKTFSPRALISESAISGTPVLLSDGEMSKILWEDNGKMMIAKLQKENFNIENKQQFGDGQVLASVINNGKILVSYVKKESETQSIWLSVLTK